nr:hypothetical protein [Tanacetum cinerariifolium]
MTVDEVTLAQALMEIKSTKPKAKGIVLQEPSESRTTTTKIISSKKSQDKGKSIMIEEHVKLKKKDQIMFDEEVALKLQAELQAEFDKEQRLASDQLTKRLQAEEKQELNDVEKATLFMVNTFVDYKTELVEESSKKVKAKVIEGSSKRAGIKLEQESSKRAGTELEQESSKKQKIDDDKETTELNSSKDRPLMLATRRYLQWRSRFLRYINTRPNGDALRKCILSGPYKPTNVLVQAVDATDDFLAILEHTIVETPMNILVNEKAQQEQEANIELIESWDDVQVKIDADYQLAERLQAEEQQELNDEEKAKFFMQLLEKRRKFF